MDGHLGSNTTDKITRIESLKVLMKGNKMQRLAMKHKGNVRNEK